MWLSTFGVLGALTTAVYAAGGPRAQLFGRTFHGAAAGSRRVALTFDDGPSDELTPRLLDALDERGVRATFFVLGRAAERRPDLVRRAHLAGHVIGNHTQDHRALVTLSSARIEEEIDACDRVLTGILGDRPTLFRPPYGLRCPRVLRAARERALRTVLWSVTCFDWRETDPDRIERLATSQMRGGDVILLHDGDHRGSARGRTASLEATLRLIARCRSEGYDLVTVPELMGGGSVRSC